MLKLWYSQGACSLAARILLNEIGASFQGINTPVKEGATLTEEFARLNPKRRVPVLGLDDQIITELPAIMTAISSLAPERKLMGVSSMDVVRVYEWLNWLSGTVHAQGFGCLWRPQRFSDDAGAYEAIMQKGRKTIAESYGLIESRLSGSFAVGDQLSAVDPFLLVLYRWGNVIGFDMGGQYKNYSRLANLLLERDSVIEAFAAESITIHGSA